MHKRKEKLTYISYIYIYINIIYITYILYIITLFDIYYLTYYILYDIHIKYKCK